MNENSSPKRPLLLKIVCVLMGLNILQGLPHIYLVLTRSPRIPSHQTGPLDAALTAVGVFVSAWVLYDLVRLSKRAVSALGVNVIVTVGVTALNIAVRGEIYGIPMDTMIIGAVIGLSLSIGIFLYSRRLLKEGILS